MKALIDGKSFNKLIESTKRFVAKSHRNQALEYIKLEFNKETCSVTAAAIDGYRMSIEHNICLEVDEDFSILVKPTVTKCPKREKFAKIEKLDDRAYIEFGDTITGFHQVKGEFYDYTKAYADMTANEVTYKIGFNGDLLIDALLSAKASVGGTLREAVILEFRSPHEPIILKTGNENIKVVLPMRIK